MLLRLCTINFPEGMVLQSSPMQDFWCDASKTTVEWTSTWALLMKQVLKSLWNCILYCQMHFAHLKRLNISAPMLLSPLCKRYRPRGPIEPAGYTCNKKFLTFWKSGMNFFCFELKLGVVSPVPQKKHSPWITFVSELRAPELNLFFSPFLENSFSLPLCTPF